jgi:polyketide biosynthesis acyl carrier protein
MKKEKIFEIIKRNVLLTLPDLHPATVSLDKSLKDLGANSIDRMEIILASMEAIKINAPLSDFAKMENIKSLIDLMALKSI